MALKDIEKQIYQKEDREQLDKERVHDTPYSVYGKHPEAVPNSFKPSEDPEKPFFQKYKKHIVKYGLVSLAILIVGIIAGGLYTLNQQRFSDKRVTLEITGEDAVSAGEEIQYTLTYRNNNLVSLRNVKLTVNTPNALVDPSLDILGQKVDQVREFELPELAPRSEGQIIIKGRLIGEKGSVQYLNATLSYIPAIVTSSFETETEFATTISDSPLVIDIQSPLESVSGDLVEYNIAVNNRSNTDLEDIELRLEYPDTFAFVSSNLQATGNGNTVFKIPRLRAKGVYEVKVTGNLGGELQSIKILKAQVGEFRQGNFTLYANAQNSTKLSDPYVSIRQVVVNSGNGVVNAGETLQYEITIRNNTQVRIGEGILKVKLDSNLLDISKLETNGADFDAGENTIIWRANRLPQLKSFPPNEEGKVTFSVPVKSIIPIDDFQDVNYRIKTQVFFESQEVPTQLGVNKLIQGNSSEVKLATRLIPKTSIAYTSPVSSIINSGPIPLKLSQTTTFAVSWEIQNLTNDVSGVTLKSTLPANVTWTGQSTTNGIGTLTYNERTKEIVWNIGNIPANTGVLRPLYRAVFQIGITPTRNQLGSEVNLLDAVFYTGKDIFTDKDMSGKIDASSTRQVGDIGRQLNVEE
jgi:hypothetical protein